MTPEDLRRAENAHQQAQDVAEAARLKRNALVLRALSEGWTQAQVAEATGLSTGRVGQLAQAGGRRVFVAHGS